MARERVEDLGRLLIMLEMLLDHDLFDKATPRPKDFPDWLKANPVEAEEYIRQLPYWIEEAAEHLYKMILITKGQDFLNEEGCR